MAYTDAGKRATIKYVKNHLDRIEVRSQKGLKSVVSVAAAAAGQSVNAYILQAINERMQREGFQPSNIADVTSEVLEDEQPPT